MVKYLCVLISLNFLIIPLYMQSMDPPPFPKKTTTLAWLNNNEIIFASRRACYLKKPFLPDAKCKLHDELTYHIIINKNKTKVGLLCAHSFCVYDIQTPKKIYSLPIPYSDNYSATFSPTDDVIMLHKGCVSINNKQTLNLPYIQSSQLFDITCNHQTEEIMYPSTNNTFSRKSLANDQVIRHPRSFNHDGINYEIDSAFYTPHKNYIILHAHETPNLIEQQMQEFFLLDTITKTISNLPLPLQKGKCSRYYDVKILPDSLIAAALCNKKGLHFFDIMQKEPILVDLVDRSKGYACKNNKKAFDFNAQAIYYTVITNKKSYLNKTPEGLLRYRLIQHNIYPAYSLLCNYFQEIGLFIPKDIKFLLIHYFYKVYKGTLQEDFR